MHGFMVLFGIKKFHGLQVLDGFWRLNQIYRNENPNPNHRQFYTGIVYNMSNV